MPRIRKHELAKLTEPQRYDLLDQIRAELRRMVKAGEWDGDPDEHPIQAITRIAYDASSNNTLKFMCLKTMLEFVAAPKAAQLRLDQNGNPTDLNVTVVVAPWAANQRAELVNEPLALTSGISQARTDAELDDIAQRVRLAHNPSHNDDESVE